MSKHVKYLISAVGSQDFIDSAKELDNQLSVMRAQFEAEEEGRHVVLIDSFEADRMKLAHALKGFGNAWFEAIRNT